jgi:hypothetical protein
LETIVQAIVAAIFRFKIFHDTSKMHLITDIMPMFMIRGGFHAAVHDQYAQHRHEESFKTLHWFIEEEENRVNLISC